LGYLFANNIRLSGTVDSENAWLVQMDWSAPFRVGGDEGFEALPPKMFPRGGVEGVVFLDTNGDGIHQPGEETLSDVGIFAPGISGMTSDGEGRFRGWGLPTTGTVALELDMLTMDALFLPERQRTRFRVRPGEMARIDTPLCRAAGSSPPSSTRRVTPPRPPRVWNWCWRTIWVCASPRRLSSGTARR